MFDYFKKKETTQTLTVIPKASHFIAENEIKTPYKDIQTFYPEKTALNPNPQPIHFRKDSDMGVMKKDGWANVFTGLNILGRDKRTGGIVSNHQLSQQQIEALMQADDIAKKVVNRPAEEMLREGFKIILQNDENNVPEQTMAIWDRFQLKKKLLSALKWARGYGGSAILIGVDDGQDPSMPVDWDNIKTIEYIAVLDRWRIFPAGIINYDVTSSNYGNPDYYRVYTMQTVLPLIHHSRIIRFEGEEVPWRLRGYFNYWGDSIFTAIFKVLRDYQSVFDNVALVVQDFTQLIVKIKNLTEMLAMGPDGDTNLMKRLQLLSLVASNVNALVIETDEEMERKSTNVAGLADLVNAYCGRLVAATQLPHTELFGESPSGLGATGDSEKRTWYDHIKNEQNLNLMPQIMMLLRFIFKSKDGPTKGQLPVNYAIEFNPLWQMTEMEKIKARNLQQQTDIGYIQAGVLDDEEVANSRFGSGQYSAETQIKNQKRNPIEESIAEGLAEELGPPNDKDSPPVWEQQDPGTTIVDPAPKLTNATSLYGNTTTNNNQIKRKKGKKKVPTPDKTPPA